MAQSTTQTDKITLEPGLVSLAQLRNIYTSHRSFELYKLAWEDIETSAIAVQKIVDKGDAAYGINTGFGLLAQTRVEDEQLALLQRNLVLSHCTGVP
jgi:histidine ammonia-lyase